MPERPLPVRPRLADHALLRRHIVGGVEKLWIHDAATDEVHEMDSRAFEIVRGADGTRDVGGVALAAVRSGVYRRASDVEAVLAELNRRGLLADGLEPEPPVPATPPERPLEVLDGFRLRCDANGTCCSTHGAIAFTRPDVERARAFVPEVLGDDAGRSRGFLPLQGSAPSGVLVVTHVDGRCPYLAADGRCRIQNAAGQERKPLGCRLFPATFADDGEVVRVSVSLECPCVLESVGATDGAELIPRGATTAGDLLAGTPIVRLPSPLRVAGSTTAPASDLGPWSRAVVEAASSLRDPLAALWTLADGLRDAGLDVAAAVAALGEAAPPAPSSLGFPLMRLASQARSEVESIGALGGDDTPPGRLARWLAEAAESLTDAARVEASLEGPGRWLDQERFAVRSGAFGHLFVRDRLTLEQSLRDQAVRLLLARRLGQSEPDEALAGHPAVWTPLVVVEALMRGRGLERYMVG